MKKIFLLLLAFVCLKAFSQCASQTVIPNTAFRGKFLATNGTCLTYQLNMPLVIGEQYTFILDLHSMNNGTCGNSPPDCSLQCQIYFGYDSCDESGQQFEINNAGGFPFADTMSMHTFMVHPSQPFTYVSLVYYYNTGQTFIGCPAALTIDSFYLISAATPITATAQVNNNSCTSDSNGKATVHATGYAPFSYLWNNGEIDSVLQHASAGIYNVRVRDSMGCLAYDTVVIGTQSPPTANISQHGDTIKAPSAVSYQWYLNGFAIAGATSQNYFAQQNGNYTVVIVDSTGCTSIPSNTIPISDVTGLTELTRSQIQLYPNPAGSYIAIYSENSPMVFKIYDFAGREILSKELNGKENELDLSQVSRGIYLVRIQQGGNYFCQKLIIQ